MGEEMQEKERLWDAAPGYDFIEKVDVPEMHSYFLYPPFLLYYLYMLSLTYHRYP